MPHYRIFSLDRAGHFIDVQEIFCTGDAEAIRAAGKLAVRHGREVWHRGRLVGRVAVSASASTEANCSAMRELEPDAVAAAL